MTPETTPETFSGWGRTAPSVATAVEVDLDELRRDPRGALPPVGARGAIARGLGRSYGDPSQNGGGVVVLPRSGNDPIRVDRSRDEATVDASVSLDELMRATVPQGYFVPVTPGTRFATVGGAVAADIHGKNHHADGTFGSHCTRLGLVLADGTHRSITPADGDLWWATIGGMGLTGLITDATFDLIPIETSRCVVTTERLPDLEAVIAAMESGDDRFRYSVAWIDLVAGGKRLGRSVLTRGDHATLDDLPTRRRRGDPLAFDPPALLEIPPGVPNVLSRPAVRAFNELWYRKAPKHRTDAQTITEFFHPLDMVGSWNRLYGRSGFLQYQFVVPFAEVDTLRRIIERVVASGYASFLAVLKRFGAANQAMLSFPQPGWTLTLDLPAGAPGLGAMLAALDEMVLSAGGRHYLAKDAHITPAVLAAGYPRLDEWRAVRRSVDPDGRWISDQSRRLRLTDQPDHAPDTETSS